MSVATQGLCKRFVSESRSISALEDIDLQIAESEFVSIVGPSGCGKTTLLHIVGGLVKPTSGVVKVSDVEVAGPGTDRGIVFQEHALLPWRTIFQNIELALEAKNAPKDQRPEIISKLIGLVGLKGFERAYPHELSGGMKQRVSICRALALDPKVLLMDEPFANLDAQTRLMMEQELNELWKRTKKTVMFVTHDLDEAIALSDYIVVFTSRPGRIKGVFENKIERESVDRARADPRYGPFRDAIWSQLRDEVLKASKRGEG